MRTVFRHRFAIGLIVAAALLYATVSVIGTHAAVWTRDGDK